MVFTVCIVHDTNGSLECGWKYAANTAQYAFQHFTSANIERNEPGREVDWVNTFPA